MSYSDILKKPELWTVGDDELVLSKAGVLHINGVAVSRGTQLKRTCDRIGRTEYPSAREIVDRALSETAFSDQWKDLFFKDFVWAGVIEGEHILSGDDWPKKYDSIRERIRRGIQDQKFSDESAVVRDEIRYAAMLGADLFALHSDHDDEVSVYVWFSS